MKPSRPLAFPDGRDFAASRGFDRLGAEFDIAHERIDRSRFPGRANILGSPRRGPVPLTAAFDALRPGR
jgi:hypothetical protein